MLSFNSWNTKLFFGVADPSKNTAQPLNSSIDVAALSEERQAYYAQVKQDLETFWNDINKILEKPEDKMLQHVARIKFILKEHANLKSWFDIEARVSFQK